MTVLISGAGIAGLTLGLSLQAAGIPFRIFEAVKDIKPLGVGINLQPHSVRELFEMGLKAELTALGIRTRATAYFNRQGQEILTEPRGTFAGYTWPQFSVHRGGLQEMLLRALQARAGEDVVETGCRVTQHRSTPGGVEIVIEGHSAPVKGTVLIAADGINSILRAQVHPTEGPPKWNGTMMLRGTTIAEGFLDQATMAMIGTRDCKFVTYPIRTLPRGQQLINWICDKRFPADYAWLEQDWNRPGDLSQFRDHVQEMQFNWLNVPDLMTRGGVAYEYPMVDRDPLQVWTFGNMTLLGDAAHPMYPIGSNGASQAILDARVLTACFLQHDLNADALAAYEAQRRPATTAIIHANRADGPDAVLDIVADRAPDGFARIEDVFAPGELDQIGAEYKKIAGFDVEALNARASIVPGTNPPKI